MNDLEARILDYILAVNNYENEIKEIYMLPILHKCLSGYIINLKTYIDLKKAFIIKV